MRVTKSFLRTAIAIFVLAVSYLMPIQSSTAVTSPSIIQKSFSAGFSSTCALRGENVIFCVGDNSFSQLGDGSKTSSSQPRPVSIVDKGLSVTVGKSFACSIGNDELGYCWGDNLKGQLGKSGSSPYSSRIGSEAKLSDIQAGNDFACALTQASRILCWGATTPLTGQVEYESTPRDLNITGATAIAVGPEALCYVNVSVYCLGSAPFTSTTTIIGGTSGATSVAVGSDFACALIVTSVKCWGDNSKGQLGQGNTSVTTDIVEVSGLSDIKSITAGAQFACALDTSGSSYCWGDNSRNQISAGASIQSTRVPTIIPSSIAIDAGSNFLCAMLLDGAIKCTGDNSKGQSGITDSSAAPIGPVFDSGFTKVSTGTNTTCAIDAQGNLKCWGPLVPEGTDGTLFTDVSVGTVSACAIPVSGAIWCWGANGSGQLGDGSNKSATTPTVVLGLGTRKAGHVAAGYRHFCANTKDGLIFCWGDNSHQQLGYSGVDSKSAVVVPGLANAVDIASGLYHSCSLVTGGTVYCWGDNAKKQIANNSTTKLGLTLVTQTASVTKVASGGNENCFLMSDNRLNCVGENSDLQSPGLLPGTYSDVAVGNNSICVVKTSGNQVACLGSNSNLKLGRTGLKSGTLTDVATLTTGTPTTSNRQVSVGDEHACAINTDGFLKCWGSNSTGQLGSSFGFPEPFAKVTVTVSGLANVGETIFAAISSNEPQATAAYSWNKASDSKVVGLAVSGANQISYVPTVSDLNKFFNASVVLTKWGISSEGMRSANFGPIGSAKRILIKAVPTITGKTKVGQLLFARSGAWESGVLFTYQWYRGTTKISGAKSAIYKLGAADVGKQIYVAVTGTKVGLPAVVQKSLKTSKVIR